MASSFGLGSEVAGDGRFVRQESVFRRWVTSDGSSEFPAQKGRYHLYVSLACPWSHRAVIVRAVKGLEEAIGISYASPFRDERGWAFTGERFAEPATGLTGAYTDAANGFALLSEAYQATDPAFDGRVTVPVLWDTETKQIVSNESADIVRMFNGAFDAVASVHVDLYPQGLRPGIDTLNAFVYDRVNNGVYKAGFARSQAAYDEAFRALFAALAELEERLSRNRYLLGDGATEADWRLFPTLVRFDAVYYGHFKCNERRLIDYPNLWRYTRDLYGQPGVAATVAMQQIKRHYYTTHDFLNPSRIIPDGPALDFAETPTEARSRGQAALTRRERSRR
jgi:putative glutathione S-transferase